MGYESSLEGLLNGLVLFSDASNTYQWLHPNSQTFTWDKYTSANYPPKAAGSEQKVIIDFSKNVATCVADFLGVENDIFTRITDGCGNITGYQAVPIDGLNFLEQYLWDDETLTWLNPGMDISDNSKALTLNPKTGMLRYEAYLAQDISEGLIVAENWFVDNTLPVDASYGRMNGAKVKLAIDAIESLLLADVTSNDLSGTIFAQPITSTTAAAFDASSAYYLQLLGSESLFKLSPRTALATIQIFLPLIYQLLPDMSSYSLPEFIVAVYESVSTDISVPIIYSLATSLYNGNISIDDLKGAYSLLAPIFLIGDGSSGQGPRFYDISNLPRARPYTREVGQGNASDKYFVTFDFFRQSVYAQGSYFEKLKNYGEAFDQRGSLLFNIETYVEDGVEKEFVFPNRGFVTAPTGAVYHERGEDDIKITLRLKIERVFKDDITSYDNSGNAVFTRTEITSGTTPVFLFFEGNNYNDQMKTVVNIDLSSNYQTITLDKTFFDPFFPAAVPANPYPQYMEVGPLMIAPYEATEIELQPFPTMTGKYEVIEISALGTTSIGYVEHYNPGKPFRPGFSIPVYQKYIGSDPSGIYPVQSAAYLNDGYPVTQNVYFDSSGNEIIDYKVLKDLSQSVIEDISAGVEPKFSNALQPFLANGTMLFDPIAGVTDLYKDGWNLTFDYQSTAQLELCVLVVEVAGYNSGEYVWDAIAQNNFYYDPIGNPSKKIAFKKVTLPGTSPGDVRRELISFAGDESMGTFRATRTFVMFSVVNKGPKFKITSANIVPATAYDVNKNLMLDLTAVLDSSLNGIKSNAATLLFLEASGGVLTKEANVDAESEWLTSNGRWDDGIFFVQKKLNLTDTESDVTKSLLEYNESNLCFSSSTKNIRTDNVLSKKQSQGQKLSSGKLPGNNSVVVTQPIGTDNSIAVDYFAAVANGIFGKSLTDLNYDIYFSDAARTKSVETVVNEFPTYLSDLSGQLGTNLKFLETPYNKYINEPALIAFNQVKNLQPSRFNINNLVVVPPILSKFEFNTTSVTTTLLLNAFALTPLISVPLKNGDKLANLVTFEKILKEEHAVGERTVPERSYKIISKLEASASGTTATIKELATTNYFTTLHQEYKNNFTELYTNKLGLPGVVWEDMTQQSETISALRKRLNEKWAELIVNYWNEKGEGLLDHIEGIFNQAAISGAGEDVEGKFNSVAEFTNFRDLVVAAGNNHLKLLNPETQLAFNSWSIS